MRHAWTCVLVLPASLAFAGTIQPDVRSIVAERVATLTRESVWRPVAAVPIAFRTYHPQGMVKIGDRLFVSSVEVQVATRRYPQPVGGLDRDAGTGVGHLFKLDLQGRLLADLPLGEGAIYHPGGIDFDGTDIWVPVAEYRPNSRSIVYRVNPDTMKAIEVFRFADHIGGIVHDTDEHTLHGVSWGSRRFYRWALRDGRVADASPRPTLNPSHYVDYQDCKYAGRHRMLCTGVTELRQTPGSAAVQAGRHRPGRSRGWPADSPGPAAAVDRRRPGHDAQPGLDRADRDRPARLLHAGGRQVHALHLRRGHAVITASPRQARHSDESYRVGPPTLS